MSLLQLYLHCSHGGATVCRAVVVIVDDSFRWQCSGRRFCSSLAYASFDVQVEGLEDEALAHTLEREVVLSGGRQTTQCRELVAGGQERVRRWQRVYVN